MRKRRILTFGSLQPSPFFWKVIFKTPSGPLTPSYFYPSELVPSRTQREGPFWSYLLRPLKPLQRAWRPHGAPRTRGTRRASCVSEPGSAPAGWAKPTAARGTQRRVRPYSSAAVTPSAGFRMQYTLLAFRRSSRGAQSHRCRTRGR